ARGVLSRRRTRTALRGVAPRGAVGVGAPRRDEAVEAPARAALGGRELVREVLVELREAARELVAPPRALELEARRDAARREDEPRGQRRVAEQRTRLRARARELQQLVCLGVLHRLAKGRRRRLAADARRRCRGRERAQRAPQRLEALE